MKKVVLVNGCFYHIYNRGVDKRDIFLDKQDYYRFLHYLYEFNDLSRIKNTGRRISKSNERGESSLRTLRREKLVDIVCLVLIPNHFHLIVKQLIDNGISKFMSKVGTGHPMYFNQKYKRTGRLFEGPFKSKLIESDEYLMHLSRYIHLNSLDLIQPNWKKDGVKDWDKANRFVESYKWSSYKDYIGKHNFPSIINKEPLLWYFKTPEDHKRYVQSWMAKDIDLLKDLIIE